jgi:MFS family permease
MKSGSTLAAYGRLLRDNRNFRLLWVAQIVSELGDWLYVVAIYSLLLEFTGKASSVGLAVLLQMLPQVFIAPLAGVLNDRLNRRSVMIFADVCRAFIVLSMLLVTGPQRISLVWLLLVLETVMWALFEPGRGALVPKIARNEAEILTANALSSTTWSINLALGSGIGGMIAWWFGRETVFVLNAASFVISALLLRSMRVEETHAAHLGPLRARDLVDLSPVWEGLRYAFADGRRLATMMVKAGMGLLGVHWVLLPVFGERIFTGGNATLAMSLLFGARGVGSLIGSLMTGRCAGGEDRRMRRWIFWAFLLTTASYAGLSVAPTLALACLAVAVSHAGTSMVWVYSTTMLQELTEDRFRGRVLSADFAGLFVMMSGACFLTGRMIDAGMSVRTLALITGLAGLVPAVGWLACQRLWRRSGPAAG